METFIIGLVDLVTGANPLLIALVGATVGFVLVWSFLLGLLSTFQWSLAGGKVGFTFVLTLWIVLFPLMAAVAMICGVVILLRRLNDDG